MPEDLEQYGFHSREVADTYTNEAIAFASAAAAKALVFLKLIK